VTDRFRGWRRRVLGILHTGDYCRSLHFRRAVSGVRVHKALDAGCGDGWYTDYVARRKGARVNAYDIDRGRVDNLNERNTNPLIHTSQADLTAFDPESDHDLVVCVDVLEHIVDYGAALDNLAGALKPGGLLFIHVPRGAHRAYLALEVNNPLHVREGFAPDELTEALASRGLETLWSRFTFGPAASFAWEAEILLGRGRRASRALLSICFPALKLLIWFDTLTNHTAGNGLCVLARKTGAP